MNAVERAVAAGAREVERLMLPDSCAIQTATLASDSAGGATESWATATTVACQVSDLTARSAEVASKLAEVADKEITLPAETAVTGSQRIVHTKGAVVTAYKVVGVNDRSLELSRSVFVQVVR